MSGNVTWDQMRTYNRPVPVGFQMPSSLESATKTVATAGSAEALAASSTPLISGLVYVRPLSTNTGNVYIGGSGVDSDSFELQPGDPWLPFSIGDLANVYLDVDTDGEGVKYLAS